LDRGGGPVYHKANTQRGDEEKEAGGEEKKGLRRNEERGKERPKERQGERVEMPELSTWRRRESYS
jgi:hypothetical protein